MTDQNPIEMARRVASEYGTKDSQIDSGNLYAALCQCLDHIEGLDDVLRAIHSYAHDHSTGPTAPDALWEIRSMAGAGI